MQSIHETAAPLGVAEDTTRKFGSLPLNTGFLNEAGVCALSRLKETWTTTGVSRLNEAAVIAMTGVPRTTMYRKISTGKFPAPIKPDGWKNVWRVEDVRAWVLAKAVVEDAARLPDADTADLMLLASGCDPVLFGRVFPRVAGLVGLVGL